MSYFNEQETAKRIAALKELMKARKLDAALV